MFAARTILVAGLLVAGACCEADAADRNPGDGLIVARAQQFVAEHFRRPDQHFFDIAFDVAHLHPQPGGDYWAVAGGFGADRGRGYDRHIFVAAVRLVCPDAEATRCWKLEKLAIDRNVVVD